MNVKNVAAFWRSVPDRLGGFISANYTHNLSTPLETGTVGFRDIAYAHYRLAGYY